MLSAADSVDSSLNLEVSSQSQETQDNSDDDDVIEVVIDETPIEILSDGEEFDIQIQQSQDALKAIVIENVQYTPENHDEIEKSVDPVEDPLRNVSRNRSSFCSDLLNALDPPLRQNEPLIEVTVPSEAEFNTKIAIEPTVSTSKDLQAENSEVITNDVTQENTDRTETSVPKESLTGLTACFTVQSGRSVLMIDNYRYMKHYTSRRGRTRWRCCKSFNRCLAIAITYENQILKLNDVHNHEPQGTSKTGPKPSPSLDFSDSFNPQSSQQVMPTLEISPLDENDKHSRITDRIVVKPCNNLFH